MNNKKNILENILMSNDIVDSINNNLGIILNIIPEIKNMINFEHKHPHHHLDVWNHTLLALSLSESDFDIRLCLLLHDIGKPHSYQEGEIRHFKGHPTVSSHITRLILNRLDYDKNFIEEMCYLIEKHDTPIKKEDIVNNIDLEFKRFKIQYCDALAHNPKKLDKRIKYLNETLEFINDQDYKSKKLV